MKIMFSAKIDHTGRFHRPLLTRQHVRGGCSLSDFMAKDANKIPKIMNVKTLPKNVTVVSRNDHGMSYFEVTV